MENYSDVQKYYKALDCWGMSCCIDIKQCSPEMIRSEFDIRKYLIKLCTLIDMSRFGQAQIVNFGADEKVAGFSMVQFIETSLISGHFSNLNNSAFIDIFSCKIYNPYKAAEFSQNFLKGTEHKLQVNFRR